LLQQDEISVAPICLATTATNFIPSADYLIVEGTSQGRMSGKSWAGGDRCGCSHAAWAIEIATAVIFSLGCGEQKLIRIGISKNNLAHVLVRLEL
jgi:hypothetical protein